MPVATGTHPATWGSIRSMRLLFVILGLVLSAGVLPARAGYDWCSVDPTITLERAGGTLAHAMDIQVMVPRSVLPMAGTALLGVSHPSNVSGTEVLNTSTPLFNIKTNFTRTNAATRQDSFRVTVSLKMPRPKVDYPVRLVIINQNTKQTIMVKQGKASGILTLAVDSMDLRELAKGIR